MKKVGILSIVVFIIASFGYLEKQSQLNFRDTISKLFGLK